jgi:hypothetical protein
MALPEMAHAEGADDQAGAQQLERSERARGTRELSVRARGL